MRCRLPCRSALVIVLLLLAVPARAVLLDGVGEATVTPQLGAGAPLDTAWRAETGQQLRLGDYFGRRPVMLVPVYYDCPNICGIVLGSLLDALGPRGLARTEILAYSIDPAETPELAAKSKALHAAGRSLDLSHVHFLTGGETAIRTLSDAVGYRFAWDPALKQFAHASTLILLTADGRISGYMAGLGGTPDALETALDRAASGEASPPSSSFLLLCYHYIASIGRYSGLVRYALQAAAGATILILAFLVGRALWRENRASRS